jgi:cation diffusion facilitator CzcD-associated flavoprotein CzcO
MADYEKKPDLLSREDLASQVRRYVATFHLNMINSAQIQSTQYDPSTKRWIIKFQTPAGQRNAISKHVVMATGIGSQKLHVPSIANEHLYKGISMHSVKYKNAEELKEMGVKVNNTSIPILIRGWQMILTTNLCHSPSL